MKIEINKIIFKNKKEAQEYARQILYNGPVGSLLNDSESEFMRAYFIYFHSNWKQKFGIGLKEFKRVKDHLTGRYKAFEVIRKDGSKTDISYIASKKNKINKMRDFKKALRDVIYPQILEYKLSILPKIESRVNCQISGISISRWDCHIDHFDPTFEEIVQNFIVMENITNVDQLILQNKDNQYVPKIVDSELADRFYQYHLKVAKLRPLHQIENLKRKKKENLFKHEKH